MTRSEQILKLIVEHFIKTAQPVASQTLIDEYGLEVSSATIRNEMNALEKDGFIEKTHTSSGRVPSSKGYRYYVEKLREDRIDDKVKYALQSVLEKRTQSVEQIIAQSCEILANMTNLATVVLGPKTEEERLVSLQIIPIGTNTATAVFVTDQGYVENKTFMIEESISMDDLVKAVATINDRLKGTPISELVPKMEAMRPAVQDFMVGQDVIYQALLEAFLRFASERMTMRGKENLLDQPEFAEDAKKLRNILELLDDPAALREAMKDIAPNQQGVKVAIGEEGQNEDVSIVSATIAIPGGQNASLSLVGPRRMDYDRAVAMLEYVSKTLDDYFNPKEGEDKWEKTKTKKTPSTATKPKETKKK